MPAVSQREYLRHSTGQDSADAHEEQLEQHAEEDVSPKAPPAAGMARPFAARRFGTSAHTAAKGQRSPDRFPRSETYGEQHYTPEPGHAQGVPPPKPVLPGTHNYAEPATITGHAPLDVGPAKPYYSAGMAHGVPTTPSHRGRPAPAHDEQIVLQTRQQTAEETGRAPDPVPVYITTRGGGHRPLVRAALQRKIVPFQDPSGGPADPFILVPRNPHARGVRLLNESATVGVRLTFDPVAQPSAAPGYGALLPAGMTSYLEITTQDEIWAYTEPGAAANAGVSVITQYDIPDGG